MIYIFYVLDMHMLSEFYAMSYTCGVEVNCLIFQRYGNELRYLIG